MQTESVQYDEPDTRYGKQKKNNPTGDRRWPLLAFIIFIMLAIIGAKFYYDTQDATREEILMEQPITTQPQSDAKEDPGSQKSESHNQDRQDIQQQMYATSTRTSGLSHRTIMSAGLAVVLLISAFVAMYFSNMLISTRPEEPVLPVVDPSIDPNLTTVTDTAEDAEDGSTKFLTPTVIAILAVGSLCALGAISFAIWNAFLKWDTIKDALSNPAIELTPGNLLSAIFSLPGLGFLLSVAGALVAFALGVWQLGLFSNLTLFMVLSSAPAIWFFVGMIGWLAIGLAMQFKMAYIEKDLFRFFFVISTFPMFMGGMGALGGIPGVSCAALMLMLLIITAIKKSKKTLEQLMLIGSVLLAVGSTISVYFGVGLGFPSFGLACASVILLFGDAVIYVALTCAMMMYYTLRNFLIRVREMRTTCTNNNK